MVDYDIDYDWGRVHTSPQANSGTEGAIRDAPTNSSLIHIGGEKTQSSKKGSKHKSIASWGVMCYASRNLLRFARRIFISIYIYILPYHSIIYIFYIYIYSVTVDIC